MPRCFLAVALPLAVYAMFSPSAAWAQARPKTDRERRLEEVQAVKTLTVAEARAVVQEFRGGSLPLNSLQAPSADVADALSAYDGTLSLNGVAVLDDAVSSALAKTKGQLTLEGLTALTSVSLARKLASQAIEVDLSRIAAVGPEIADALSTARGRLVMSGLRSLDSPALAKKLATGEDVALKSVTKLTPEVARALVSEKNYLYLNGITQLKKDVAAELGRHVGLLDLDLLEPCEAGVVEELAKCKGPLDLGVTTLTRSEAQAIARHEGIVTLARLATAQPDVLAELREHKDMLYLTGLTQIGVPEAESLAGCKGVIYLTGVTAMDQEAAVALAKHRGSGGSCLVLGAALSVSPVAPVLSKNSRIAFGSHLFR